MLTKLLIAAKRPCQALLRGILVQMGRCPAGKFRWDSAPHAPVQCEFRRFRPRMPTPPPSPSTHDDRQGCAYLLELEKMRIARIGVTPCLSSGAYLP